MSVSRLLAHIGRWRDEPGDKGAGEVLEFLVVFHGLESVAALGLGQLLAEEGAGRAS